MPPAVVYEDDLSIKNEEDWSGEESDNTNPDLGPLVTTIFEQLQGSSMTEPHPLESTSNPTEPRSVAKHISQPPNQSKHTMPRRRHVHGNMEERLANMPEIRPMPWRPGTEVPDELETGGESRRKQIRYGCLLATRGNVVAAPCKTCSSGRGKFTVCVALEGFFKGACASCQLSGRPNRCTIKQQDDPKPNIDPVDSGIIMTPDRNEPYLAGQEHPRSHTSTIIQYGAINSRANRNRSQSTSQPKVFNDPINHHEPTHNNNNNARSKRRRTDGPQFEREKSQEQPRAEPIEHPRISWAAVNRPMPVASPVTKNTSSRMDTNRQVHNHVDHEKREGTAPGGDISEALIDTLPKNKQRQIYGIVSGLQGGIEHLQKELDMLKKTMGIDDAD